MKKITPVDVSGFTFNIGHDSSIAASGIEPGPPKAFDGFSMGVVTMERSPPHGGEVHLDGDEILYVISGVVTLTSDSNRDQRLRLASGDACIIEKGEWHKLDVVEKAQLVYVTPGPNNKHRPQ